MSRADFHTCPGRCTPQLSAATYSVSLCVSADSVTPANSPQTSDLVQHSFINSGDRSSMNFQGLFKALIRFACLCSLRPCLYPHEVNASSLLLIFLPSVLPDVVRTGGGASPWGREATPPPHPCSARPQHWSLPLFQEIGASSSSLLNVKVWVSNRVANRHAFRAKWIHRSRWHCINFSTFIIYEIVANLGFS